MTKAKSVLLASVAGTMAAPMANAADMPVKAQPKAAAAPAIAMAPSWAGLYLGVHAGATWHKASVDQPDAYYSPLHFSDTKTGFIGGGLIGYNLQSGMVVYGLELDISGLDAKTSDSDIVFFGPGGNSGSPMVKRTWESDIDWMSTARVRLGLATGNLLTFITGGVAFADIHDKVTVSNIQPFFLPGSTTWSENKIKTGPVLGGGFDYMFSPNWIGRVEGLWADFGKTTITKGHGNYIGNNNKTTTFKNQLVVVRGALAYKF
jgi:outer membrane immunogenic protein